MGVTDQARGQTSNLIAIIDDDESMQDSLRDLLESPGLTRYRAGGCHVSRCHVSPPVTELKQPSPISSAKSKSIPIARTSQRFAMVSVSVAIGNAVARTRVILLFC